MCFPQPIASRLCTRVFLILIVTLCVTMLPLCVPAATAQLTCATSDLIFGNVVVGQSETQVVVLTNSKQTTVTVSAMNVTDPAFSASQLHLPLTLSAGQSVALNVTFSPTVNGWTGGWVQFSSDASNSTLYLEVEGTGVGSEDLAASPSTVSFGQVAVGASSTMSVVLTNLRSYNVDISGLQAIGGGFSVSGSALPITLDVGQSITVNVTFTPQSAASTGGSLWVSYESLNIPLTGTGTTTITNTAGQLSITPSPVNFGNVNVGTIASQAITVSATGGSVTVSSDASGGSQFALMGAAFPFTIPAGQSLTLNAAFSPTASGTASGSLTFNSNASNGPVTLPLSGMGITTTGQLSITPSVVNFGDVTVGSTGTQAITMSATGASVTVSSDASSNSQFVLRGASLPFTIPAGQSSSFNASFTPIASGTVSGSLSFTSNAATSQTTESLTGTGTVLQHTVSLSWNASSGTAGYNIYRSTGGTGTFTKINSTLDPNTMLTDSTVASGQTYYYEATAVDSSGQESVRSTPPVAASIP
jgi:hypothetical protein